MNKIILLITFLFTTIESQSQELTNLGLGVMNYKDTSNELLLKQLQSAKEDSSKVKLLLRLSSFYWHSVKSDDSIFYFSKQALKLGQKIRYNLGYYEASFLLCNINAKKGNIAEAKTFLSLVPKEQQVRLLLVLSEHYLFLPGEQKKNLDKAYPYLKDALSLSEAIQNLHWKEESLIALGKYYFTTGDFNKGKESFMKVIQFYHNNNDKRSEARWWYDLALYMPDTDSTFIDELKAYKNAIHLYSVVKDTSEIAEVMYDFASLYRFRGRYDSSKKVLSSAIILLKTAHKKKVYKFYLLMSKVCHLMGDLNEALFYTLETKKNMEVVSETKNMSQVNYQLGEIYASLNQHENSLIYFFSAKDSVKDQWTYITYSKAAGQLLKLQRPKEALKLLLNFEKKAPPDRLVDKETMAGAKADCYFAIKDYAIAEKYYLQMISLDVLAQRNRKNVLFPIESISGPEAYFKIGKFYVEQKKYAIANGYLSKSLQIASFDNRGSYSTDLLRNIKLMQFKADSAIGNYLSALQNFQQYTAINNSMFNSDKTKQAEQMRVSFETKEKEKNIILLQKEKLIQQGSLRQTIMTKNIAIAGILLLSIILGLLYWQFRLKQLNNQTISYKNRMLSSLLTEKEWLLKEVHHRVKNNLQTVVSLLELQSENLQGEALYAIQDSQNRIYAMSLIHQKLYQRNNIASINMQPYLIELTTNLQAVYNPEHKIHFDLQVADVELDVSQAIPVGLIVNEVVTNSIKYAFNSGSISPEISITLAQNINSNLTLLIADNGVGLPTGFDIEEATGLGFKLMKGLVNDIEGALTMEAEQGTLVTIIFNASMPFNQGVEIRKHEKEFAT